MAEEKERPKPSQHTVVCVSVVVRRRDGQPLARAEAVDVRRGLEDIAARYINEISNNPDNPYVTEAV